MAKIPGLIPGMRTKQKRETMITLSLKDLTYRLSGEGYWVIDIPLSAIPGDVKDFPSPSTELTIVGFETSKIFWIGHKPDTFFINKSRQLWCNGFADGFDDLDENEGYALFIDDTK